MPAESGLAAILLKNITWVVAAVEVTGAGINNPPLASDRGLTEISAVLSRSEINLERVR